MDGDTSEAWESSSMILPLGSSLCNSDFGDSFFRVEEIQIFVVKEKM